MNIMDSYLGLYYELLWWFGGKITMDLNGFCHGTNIFVKSVLPWIASVVLGVRLLLCLCTSNGHPHLSVWSIGLTS